MRAKTVYLFIALLAAPLALGAQQQQLHPAQENVTREQAQAEGVTRQSMELLRQQGNFDQQRIDLQRQLQAAGEALRAAENSSAFRLYNELASSKSHAADLMAYERAMLLAEQAQGGEAAKSKEEQAYAAATDAMNAGKYREAAATFDEVAKMKGRRADGALYWKAYCLNKQSQRGDALAAIAELRRSYPQSKYLQEASALELEIKNASGARVNPETESDEDLKLLALNALMQSDEERAVPMLEKFLGGNSSVKLKDKALFVLSQSGRPEARQLLRDIAAGRKYPELQTRAIHYIGISGPRKGELMDIYRTSTDIKLKKEALHAMMIAGDEEDVLQIAQSEANVDLKKEAIHTLGVMGAHTEMRKLYNQGLSPDLKRELLHSMGIGGDVDGLIEAAKSETDLNVRKEAIHSLGITGSSKARDALAAMYDANRDKDQRMEIIHALFISGDAHQLVTLAKKETDPELKKELVHRISLMGTKEGNDYLIDLLNK